MLANEEIIRGKKVEKTVADFSEEEKESLNLIAEIIVEIIISKTENERNRVCEDKH